MTKKLSTQGHWVHGKWTAEEKAVLAQIAHRPVFKHELSQILPHRTASACKNALVHIRRQMGITIEIVRNPPNYRPRTTERQTTMMLDPDDVGMETSEHSRFYKMSKIGSRALAERIAAVHGARAW